MDSGDCSKKCNSVYDFIAKFEKIRDYYLINLKDNYKDAANLALHDVNLFHTKIANLFAFFDAIAAFLTLTEDNYIIRGSKHHGANFITSLEFFEHFKKINFDYPNFEDNIFSSKLFLDEMKNILGQSKPFIIDIRGLKADIDEFKGTICSLKDYENLILIPLIEQLKSYPINLNDLKTIEIYKIEKELRGKIKHELKILEENLIKELQEKKIKLISALQKDQIMVQDSFNTPYNQPMGTSTVLNNFNTTEMENLSSSLTPNLIGNNSFFSTSPFTPPADQPNEISRFPTKNIIISIGSLSGLFTLGFFGYVLYKKLFKSNRFAADENNDNEPMIVMTPVTSNEPV
ncbi:hypothetical protein [Rickettsiella endosymbiont of Rhagonycha lignosa]|uniref:hypothetical protein n=1 Tax=Rickettsiella endosymbiont of Rhagonycha lignosa TaxID=3077937 RepID=UPI00313CDE39